MKKIRLKWIWRASLLTAALFVAACDSKLEVTGTPAADDVLKSSSTAGALEGSLQAEKSARIAGGAGKEKSEKKWELILDVPEHPVVLEDLSQVQVREGVAPPLIGTTIYPVLKLPKVACGQFWIFYGDGYIDQVWSCNHGANESHEHQ